MDIETHLMELDALRIAHGISYKALADACGVSKSTICRTFNRATEPTVQLVQRMEAAVQYTPDEGTKLPSANHSVEEYVEYLEATITRQSEDYRRHIMQMQTYYGMLHRQEHRAILFLAIGVTVLVVFLVSWLVFDILHPSIGWIMR